MSIDSSTIKKITAYDLWEFLNFIQEAFKEGYFLDDSVENFPISHIGFYTCGLVKPSNNTLQDKASLKQDLKRARNLKKDALNEEDSSSEDCFTV